MVNLMKSSAHIPQYLIVVFLVFLFCTPFQAEAERIYLDITTDKTRKISMAVPSFISTGAADTHGKKYASVLAKALEFHGIIEIFPKERYSDKQRIDWKQIGADYAVLGQYQQNNDKTNFQIRLLDVASGAEIMGKSFTGNTSQAKTMLFTFCDDIINILTGTPGIANSRIAFIGLKNNAKEVYLTDILGEDVRQITRHKNITVSPRFVPETSKLSYSSYHTGNQNLYITDLRQNKTTRALSRRKGMNLAPAWSPDGQQLILTLSKQGNPDLFLLDNRGEIIKQLTQRAGINVSPTWSPDGSHVVFVSDRSGRPQLYRMELATGNTERITYEGRENTEPSWSPKENLIAFTCMRNGVYQICTMNPFTFEMPKQLTTDFSYSESPSWSPDGKQIIYSKRGGKKNQIYAIMKDGSFERSLFSFSGSQTYPRWSQASSF